MPATLSVNAGPLDSDTRKWTDKFDWHFKKYSKRYFGPHFEWQWFKSQGIAESSLDETASSPAGAVGIMQILPSTFEEIKNVNPSFAALDNPRWNIAAGIYYDRTLYRKWRNPLPSEERLFLAFASYNAGYGRVLKAVRQTQDKHYTWVKVKSHLPNETRGYVSRIASLMDVSDRHRESSLNDYLNNLFD
jgi:membrane-bound lytic murein transglycosylase MltF